MWGTVRWLKHHMEPAYVLEQGTVHWMEHLLQEVRRERYQASMEYLQIQNIINKPTYEEEYN